MLLSRLAFPHPVCCLGDGSHRAFVLAHHQVLALCIWLACSGENGRMGNPIRPFLASCTLNNLRLAGVVTAVAACAGAIGANDRIRGDLTSAAAGLAGSGSTGGHIYADICDPANYREFGTALGRRRPHGDARSAIGPVCGSASAANCLLLTAIAHEVTTGLECVGQRHRLTLQEFDVASQHV